MKSIRVTIGFRGKRAGALGVTYHITARRTISVPESFTEEEAKEAARLALYSPDGEDGAYESVMVERVAFN